MLSFNKEKFVKQQKCFMCNILTTKKDQITRGDKESLTRRIQSLLSENLVLGIKSTQQTKNMRTKTNYKPKANDKGKENNAIFSKPGRVQYKNNELKLNTDVPYSRMSLETFQMAQRIILSFNPVTKSLGKFERRFK